MARTLPLASVRPRKRLASPRLRRQLLPYLFIAPVAATLLLVNFYPMFYSLRLSLSTWPIDKLLDGPTFSGLGNFQRMFRDHRLVEATGFMVFYVISAVLCESVIGMVVALILNSRLPARGLIRSLIILPMAVAPLVASIVWRYLLNSDYGTVNYGLSLFGVKRIGWLSTLPWARISIVIVEVWQYVPFVSLILLAGLQAVPDEYLEAARIDGASARQAFFRITLPLLRPAILVALVIRTTNAVRMFDTSFALTGGGPFGSTETFSLVAYTNAFQGFDLPYAAATSWLIFALNLAITLVFVRVLLVRVEV